MRNNLKIYVNKVKQLGLSSLNGLVSEAHDVCFREISIGVSIDAGIGTALLRQPDLGLVVNSEVGEFSLNADGYLLPDISHLQGFLPEVPLVPEVVGLDVLLHEVKRGLHALVHHEGCRYAEQRMHAVFALEQGRE